MYQWEKEIPNSKGIIEDFKKLVKAGDICVPRDLDIEKFLDDVHRVAGTELLKKDVGDAIAEFEDKITKYGYISQDEVGDEISLSTNDYGINVEDFELGIGEGGFKATISIRAYVDDGDRPQLFVEAYLRWSTEGWLGLFEDGYVVVNGDGDDIVPEIVRLLWEHYDWDVTDEIEKREGEDEDW